MKSFKILTLTILMAVLPPAFAKNFNKGSLELDGASVLSNSKSRTEGFEVKDTTLSARLLYYPVRNLALGVDITHSATTYTNNGNSDTYTDDLISPVIAYNFSLNERSGFLVGAAKLGFIRGVSKYESDFYSSSVDISGRSFFAYYRHYLSDNVGLSAGVISSKARSESNGFASPDSKTTDFSIGIIIGLPK